MLTRSPASAGSTVPVKVNVAEPPTGRSTASMIDPTPPDVPHVPPPLPRHVHVAPEIAAGTRSITVAPSTSLGPLFDATIVYETTPPGVTEAEPSVLVIARSATRSNVSVSVDVLLAGVGSVTPPGVATEATLTISAIADEWIEATTVKVTDVPAARSTVVDTSPAPDGSVHAAPIAAAHVHDVNVVPAGSRSATVAPTTFDGPLLDTTIA